VLFIVGGPQYRAGSHRQFVTMARELAARGFPAMRFDHRGIGDSAGEARSFDTLDADVRAAVDTLAARADVSQGIVLFGLCDAASAAMIYAPTDPRVVGLILLNPWAHTEATAARTRLRSYYTRRLFAPAFWKKLLRGGIDWRESARSLASRGASAFGASRGAGDAGSYIDRMLAGVERFRGPALFVTCGDDLTAAEFLARAQGSRRWRRALGRATTRRFHLGPANHTFSTAAWRAQITAECARWLEARKPT
jgi:exosortase A-associated hydrolase 1